MRADNRELLRNSKYSYLIDNYLSAVSSVQVDNSSDFTANDYVLFGNFGSETSEIVQISTVTAATHTLSLSTATKFAHSESTKLSVIPYNQVKFYQTAAATFSNSENPLIVNDPVSVKADSFYTTYEDKVNTTGYGWYVFYNSTTLKASTNSNAMPYAGFGQSTVIQILNRFYSKLNNNELKLVSRDDALVYLNTVYSTAKNQLNMVNEGFTTPTEWSFTVTSTTTEVALPDAFSDLISVTDASGNEISIVSLRDKRYWDSNAAVTEPKYYLRARYIGISPVPSSSTTYYCYYKAKTAILTLYSETVDLPDNSYNILVDGMLEEASVKIPRLDRAYHAGKFKEGIANMKTGGVKQDNQRSSWDIESSCNV